MYSVGALEGFELSLSDGLISQLRGEIIQTTAPISPVSSGGGLLDAQGRLIGITTFGHKSGQNLNFAIPAEWIFALSARTSDLIAEEERREADKARRLAEKRERRRREEERIAQAAASSRSRKTAQSSGDSTKTEGRARSDVSQLWRCHRIGESCI